MENEYRLRSALKIPMLLKAPMPVRLRKYYESLVPIADGITPSSEYACQMTPERLFSKIWCSTCKSGIDKCVGHGHVWNGYALYSDFEKFGVSPVTEFETKNGENMAEERKIPENYWDDELEKLAFELIKSMDEKKSSRDGLIDYYIYGMRNLIEQHDAYREKEKELENLSFKMGKNIDQMREKYNQRCKNCGCDE